MRRKTRKCACGIPYTNSDDSDQPAQLSWQADLNLPCLHETNSDPTVFII